ncbi:MAG: bifunctional alpha,alpha-trehalose-phosphate synthase (UDP-forming)/trehalose-phosphatase [Phycisphaerales bacterium JB063]
MSRLITVSNRLPVQLNAEGVLVRSGGGLASAMSALDHADQLWIGWPGQINVSRQAELTRRLREEQGGVPVFLEDDLFEPFYAGYANATLWPLLHYMTDRAKFEPDWFEAYRIANERFADIVLQEAREDDTVWVHDYQLMLLPAILRERRPSMKIGYFLHVPFPSHEVFRVLPEREHLLAGLLGADLIGFHTFGYLRHFRSALLRGLGQESLPGSAVVGGRLVRMGVYPIGHNCAGFDRAIASPMYTEHLRELSEEFEGRRLVLSVERLDYTKGIPQKLAAIERFLADHPERREDTVFLIIAVPSRQGVEEYQHLTEQVQLAVGEINGRYSTFSRQPIHFYHRGTDPVHLAALYALADVALVTPLIDGMNLVAKEYADCKGAPGARPGTLVLSEMAGAAQELAGAILVNPYDTQGVSEAIAEALSRSPEEAKRLMEPMRQRVRMVDAAAWARGFVTDLSHEQRAPYDPAAKPGDELVKRLASANKLALILDYDGTLRAFTAKPEDAVPSEEVLALLAALAAKPGVELTIVSGRPETFLEEHLGKLGVALFAEHGYRHRPAGDKAQWVNTNPRADVSWASAVLPILEMASSLTPGTHVEQKRSALVWHYRRADPEFGAWKASELMGSLTEVVANLPVEVNHGHKIVEVASQQVSKGAALDMLMQQQSPDLALCCGDDRTDEKMFARRDTYPNLETIKVGPGETRAAWRVADVDAIHDLLQNILNARP